MQGSSVSDRVSVPRLLLDLSKGEVGFHITPSYRWRTQLQCKGQGLTSQETCLVVMLYRVQGTNFSPPSGCSSHPMSRFKGSMDSGWLSVCLPVCLPAAQLSLQLHVLGLGKLVILCLGWQFLVLGCGVWYVSWGVPWGSIVVTGLLLVYSS